mgnify:CR=1 FL=1
MQRLETRQQAAIQAGDNKALKILHKKRSTNNNKFDSITRRLKQLDNERNKIFVKMGKLAKDGPAAQALVAQFQPISKVPRMGKVKWAADLRARETAARKRMTTTGLSTRDQRRRKLDAMLGQERYDPAIAVPGVKRARTKSPETVPTVPTIKDLAPGYRDYLKQTPLETIPKEKIAEIKAWLAFQPRGESKDIAALVEKFEAPAPPAPAPAPPVPTPSVPTPKPKPATITAAKETAAILDKLDVIEKGKAQVDAQLNVANRDNEYLKIELLKQNDKIKAHAAEVDAAREEGRSEVQEQKTQELAMEQLQLEQDSRLLIEKLDSCRIRNKANHRKNSSYSLT